MDAFRNQDEGDAEYDELDGAAGDNDNDDVQDSSNESIVIKREKIQLGGH